MDAEDRRDAAERARAVRDRLAVRDVSVIAVTWVDNSGITRTKAVPIDRLESAAAWGIGVSPVFDTFLFTDIFMISGAVGDLRLHPDVSRLTELFGQTGWAWAPGDRYDQNGMPHPVDQRTIARIAMDALAVRGFRARMAFEVEWVIARPDPENGDFVPALRGPAYGHARLVDRWEYIRDLVITLKRQGIEVDQVHPEYSPGQFEVSVAAADPLAAADDVVLVRETIRAVSARHGLWVSFAPKVTVSDPGNGGHVHMSLWRDDANLFAGGEGRFGLTRTAESFVAGVLDRLPALLAIGAPSVASYLRLMPQQWAGAFAAWGLENREAALRLVMGPAGNRARAANIEVKCFDQAANPYLVVAGLIFAGLAGVDAEATLPEPVDVDPALLSDQERAGRGIQRLPATLGESTDAFANDATLTGAFGGPLTDAIIAVRRGEIAHFATATSEEITAQQRWVY